MALNECGEGEELLMQKTEEGLFLSASSLHSFLMRLLLCKRLPDDWDLILRRQARRKLASSRLSLIFFAIPSHIYYHMNVHQKGADDSRNAEKNKTNWMRDICFFLSYCGHLSGTVHKIKKLRPSATYPSSLPERKKTPSPRYVSIIHYLSRHLSSAAPSCTSRCTSKPDQVSSPHRIPSHQPNSEAKPPQQVQPEPHTCERGGGGGVPELLESTKPHSLTH